MITLMNEAIPLLDLLLNLLVFGYCSIGLIALMLTISRENEPLSIT